MDFVSGVGYLAAFLTTVAYFPQVIHTWKTRSTKDISLGMFLTLFMGISSWFLYGLLKGDLPLILANGITMVLSGIILWFKLRYR